MPSRGVSHPAPLPQLLYRGSANSWECDEGGHLNIRFHVERALTGLAHMALALKMPRAFTPTAGATLVVREAHMRFLKEALPGAPLTMHGGIVQLDDTEATLCFDMRHGDGAPASTFTLRVAHVETREFRAFPWSQRARAAANQMTCALPAHAAPRSIDVAKPPSEMSRQAVIDAGAARIGAAIVSPDQCDAFGRLRGEHFIGRVSDSVPNLLSDWRRETAADSGSGPPAGAVVEARMVLRRFPRAGELIEVHSGLIEVGEKTIRLVHCIVDPETGAAWASMEVVALTFDTVTRKTIAPSADARARMEKRIVKLAV
jgi:acyl-CoA thioester hydrolase